MILDPQIRMKKSDMRNRFVYSCGFGHMVWQEYITRRKYMGALGSIFLIVGIFFTDLWIKNKIEGFGAENKSTVGKPAGRQALGRDHPGIRRRKAAGFLVGRTYFNTKISQFRRHAESGWKSQGGGDNFVSVPGCNIVGSVCFKSWAPGQSYASAWFGAIAGRRIQQYI